MTERGTGNNRVIPLKHSPSYAPTLSPARLLTMAHSLTLHVAVFGDPSEVKCLRFVWFKASKTLFEFYGAKCSLRQKIENVPWFPKELPTDDPVKICELFNRSALSSSIFWNYVFLPSHIQTIQWNRIGVAKMKYIDTYCTKEATKASLTRNICNVIIKAVLRIQSYYTHIKK